MRIIVLVVLFAVGGCAATPAAPNTPGETVVLFRAAIAERDGSKAVSHLSRDTLSLYSAIRTSALCAPKAELGSDPLFERATALAFRQAVDPRFLREATVEQLAAHVVREAWLTGPHLSKPTVANVEYYEDYAVARVTYPEGAASYLRLVREAGFWKIDLRPTLRQSNDAAARLGRNEDVVVLNLVEQMTGSRPGDDIWEPPLAGHPYCAE